MSSEFVPVARVADIMPGTAVAVIAGGREIAIFNVDGTFYALDNTCPHQGGPLADGYIEGATVTCPWHAWCFRLSDGKMTLGDFAEVETFELRVDGDRIAVRAHPRAR
ncbi:MAG: nitrite reductase small subunit NirD [Candidatus Velthaea sp.]